MIRMKLSDASSKTRILRAEGSAALFQSKRLVVETCEVLLFFFDQLFLPIAGQKHISLNMCDYGSSAALQTVDIDFRNSKKMTGV